MKREDVKREDVKLLGKELQIPPAPGDPVITAVSASRICLAWAGSPSATGYAIFRSLDGASGWALIASVDAVQTSFVDDGLSAGTTYYYRVAATSPAGTSPRSTIVVETTAPASPTNIIAITRSASTAVVSWSSFGGETGFTVMASCDGGAHYIPVGMTGPEATSYEVASLSAGTEHRFQVIARNVAGPSAPGGPARATTAPVAPAGVNAIAASPGEVDVSWTASSGTSGYDLQRSTDGVTFTDLAPLSGGVTSYADTAVAAGARYWYRVVAVNAGGPSLPSTPAATTTPASSPLGLLARAVSDTEIDLAWNALPQATGYAVQVTTGGAPIAEFGPAPAGTATFRAMGLMPGARYVFRVVAAGPAFKMSNVIRASTANESPRNVVATAVSARQVSIVWSFVTGAAGYVVERSPDGVTGWASVGSTIAGTTQLTDDSVAAGTEYFYRVLATDAGGNSAPSAVVAARTPPQPPVPTDTSTI